MQLQHPKKMEGIVLYPAVVAMLVAGVAPAQKVLGSDTYHLIRNENKIWSGIYLFK